MHQRIRPWHGIVILGVLAATLLPVSAFSQNRYSLAAFYRSTHDEPIIQAFYRLQASESGEDILEAIVEKPVRVIFKDLQEISKKVRNYDALSWISTTGHHAVFINHRHKGAPPEALAALIAHEVLHDDAANSLNEEVAGWSREAAVWQELKAKHPELASIPKGTYPLVDRLNLLEEKYKNGQMAHFVREQAAYQGLPETSPGY